MTKSERLFFLAQLVRNRAPITIKQMSSECGVSERTLYRDVNALSELNVPIFHDPGKGYRLARNIDFGFGDMCSEDADLILVCLYHNPMNKSPFFKRRLMLLKEILQQKFESHTSYNIDKFFFYEATYNGFSEKHEEKIIKFAFALFSQNYVSVSEKGNFSTKQMLIPIGIRFTENGATFVLYSEETQFDLRIDVEDIEAISISHSRFTHRPKVDMKPYRVENETA